MIIGSRNELIDLGGTLAAALQAESFDKTWMISLRGTADSGKGLLALAMDRYLNPLRYPDGITKELSADTLLAPGNEGKPQIVFCNFYKANAPAKGKKIAERLSQFKTDNPDARILIAANVELPPTSGDQILSLRGTDCVDVDLLFHRQNELIAEFPRSSIDVRTQDALLGVKLSKRIFSDNLKRSSGRFTVRHIPKPLSPSGKISLGLGAREP